LHSMAGFPYEIIDAKGVTADLAKWMIRRDLGLAVGGHVIAAVLQNDLLGRSHHAW
jgi:hypothetical protein